MEITFWETIKESANPADFEAYLRKFPSGVFAGLARNRLESLKEQQPEALKEQQVALATPEQVPSSSKPMTRAQRGGEWTAKDGKWSIYLTIEGSSVKGKAFSQKWAPWRIKGEIDIDGRFSGWVTPKSSGVADTLRISGVFPVLKIYKSEYLLERSAGDLEAVSE